jgi:hypothetical protein
MTDKTKPISSSNPPESKGDRAKIAVETEKKPQAPLSKKSLDEPPKKK